MTCEHEEIGTLRKIKVKHNLALSIEKLRKAPVNSYVRVRITLLLNQVSIIIPVCDELDEANSTNQLLLLQLVLMECGAFESSTDFLDWANSEALNASESKVMELYGELKTEVPKLREIIGTDIKIISDWDFEMNAGAAYELRNLSNS